MKKWIRSYAGILLGAVITATALNMFLIPHKIAAGGTSGLATVLHHLAGLPVGATMLSFDIPLLLVSIKILGARFGFNTLIGAIILSVSIDITAPFIPTLTSDLLLNSLYGGILSGIGLGLVFRFEGSTAGTDLAAAIINKLFGISVGQALLMVDCFVIILAGVAFQSAELSLYALISLFVSTQIIDLVQEGPSSAKAFFIVSSKASTLAEAVLTEMDRGVTFLHATGGYTQEASEVLLCVVSTREVSRLKELIYALDRAAFVIVADAHEVMGEGFAPVKK
ncbi:MAG: YitT family protein [Pelosinus sp.]|nr:YitT family protein [Pelosinus sp.]